MRGLFSFTFLRRLDIFFQLVSNINLNPSTCPWGWDWCVFLSIKPKSNKRKSFLIRLFSFTWFIIYTFIRKWYLPLRLMHFLNYVHQNAMTNCLFASCSFVQNTNSQTKDVLQLTQTITCCILVLIGKIMHHFHSFFLISSFVKVPNQNWDIAIV